MLLALLLLACARPPASQVPFSDPADPGLFDAGVTTRHFIDARGKALTVEIWYPAAAEPGDEPDPYPELAFTLDAYRDAPPVAGPWPLVAFSHGYGGIRWQSAFLTEHLARHGFVVVAPDHPHNTLYDLDPTLTAEVAAERPGDIVSSVDYVHEAVRDPRDALVGMVASSAYGVVGHSFGAFTALVVGGGVLDPASGAAWCAEHDPAGCDFFADLDTAVLAQAVPDPRASATVTLAPGGWYAFGDDGLQGVRAPLELAGDADSDLPYDEEGRPTWEALGAPKRLLTLHGAGHWGFTDLCRFVPGLLDCSGASGGFMEPERVRTVTKTAVTASLEVQVAHDDRYQPFVDAPAWEGQDDVTFEEAAPPGAR